MVNNLLANTEDGGLTLGLRRSPGEGNGNLFQYFCLGIPWTEWPGGLQSMGSQRVGHDLVTKKLYIYIYTYIHTHYVFHIFILSSMDRQVVVISQLL